MVRVVRLIGDFVCVFMRVCGVCVLFYIRCVDPVCVLMVCVLLYSGKKNKKKGLEVFAEVLGFIIHTPLNTHAIRAPFHNTSDNSTPQH